MKIGIVGSGMNSDYHINFAKAYAGAEIVGIVDKDELKARECANRHDIKNVFTTIGQLIEEANPEVVHILTPPKTHFQLAREVIESKRHVLVEKPIALDYAEAEELYKLAEKNGVKLCAMHNHFYDPCMAKANDLVKSGKMGSVVNVESYYGLNTRIEAFRGYPVPNALPWLYGLPGGVYQDFMPHSLYVLLEYTGKPIEIKVMEKSYGILPQGMPDEIRVLINGEKAMGTVTISFAAMPHLQIIRIYGTKMMAEVDINTMTIVTHPLSSLPKAAQKATYNLGAAWQLFKSTTVNVINFITGRLKPYQGMKRLIHKFYESIENNSEPPVSKEQALCVIETMDEIIKQLEIKPLVFENIVPSKPLYPIKHKEKILVTGGTGFLGKRTVELLVAKGYAVRVLVRKLSNIKPLQELGVELFYGDVADRESLKAAFESVNVVIHAAAGTSGEKRDSETGTLAGTQNVLELCRDGGIKKLIYISSCAVYGVADYKTGQVVTEEASLERYPDRRGNYSASKQEAESYVIDEMKNKSFPIVIFRPGSIFGPGGDVFTGMIGFSLKGKAFIVIGDGKFELPFVYIDNLVGVIIKSIKSKKAENQIFNVVDSEKVDKRLFMDKLIKKLYPKTPVLYFPYKLLYGITFCQELFFKLLGKNPVLTRYRLDSSQKNIRYDNSKIIETLKWTPNVSVDDALTAIYEYEKKR